MHCEACHISRAAVDRRSDLWQIFGRWQVSWAWLVITKAVSWWAGQLSFDVRGLVGLWCECVETGVRYRACFSVLVWMDVHLSKVAECACLLATLAGSSSADLPSLSISAHMGGASFYLK